MTHTRLRFLVGALAFAILGLALLYLGEKVDHVAHGAVRSAILSVGGVLIASVALGSLWEFWGRAGFLDDIMGHVQMDEQLRQAGITRVTGDYLHGIPWHQLLAETSSVDLMVAHARTWRHSFAGEITTLLERNSQVRIVLPDLDDTKTVSALSARFDMTSREFKAAVQETIDFVAQASSSGLARVTIFAHKSNANYTYYGFDSVGVMTLYPQAKGRASRIPTIQFNRDGALGSILGADFERVIAESRELSLA